MYRDPETDTDSYSGFQVKRKRSGRLTVRVLWVIVVCVTAGWVWPAHAVEDATSQVALDWQPVPASATLVARPSLASPCFHYLHSEGDRIILRFDWNTIHRKNYPTQGERFDCLIVAPRNGVATATEEYQETLYLQGGNLVHLTAPPEETGPSSRLKTESIGEFRGAELICVEFRPSLPLSGNPGADTSFVQSATFTLELKEPFREARPTNELLQRALQLVVLNPQDLPRCLPPVSPGANLSDNRLQQWRQPTVKIRTSAAGWYGIPVSRLTPFLNEGTRIENLRLQRRAPLVPTIPRYRDPDDSSRYEDNPVTFGIRKKKSEWRTSGPLDPADTLVFHADLSTSPDDPRECYWLTSGVSDTQQDLLRGANQLSVVYAYSEEIPTATVESVVGKDRIFVEGGLRTHQQDLFWVDSEFPEDSTGPLQIPLPQWIADSIRPVTGHLRVIFGSSMKEAYSAEDRLKGSELALSIGEATMACTLEKEPDGYGYTAIFQIPKGVSGETMAVRYLPGTPPRNPLYFDDLRLTGSTPMIWSGTDVIYRQPTHPSFRLEDRVKDDSLPLVFVRSPKGKWGDMQSSRKDQQIRLVPESLTGPFSEMHLVSHLKEVDEVTPFHLPGWVDTPPQADQLVLTPQVFNREVMALGAEALQRGKKYVSINLSDVFDLFSGGQFSPYAVRNFLTWVENSWPDPQPVSLLMVGDSSWDTWGRFPHSKQVPNWSPSHHTRKHPDYPSDLWFVEGQAGDRVPNWFFGRMPCQTGQQLQGYLKKLNAQVEPGHAQRLVWATDDNPPFEKNTEDVYLQSLPLSMRLDHIRIRDYPFVDNFYYGTHLAKIRDEAKKNSAPLDYGKISPGCNEAIRKSLNQGAAIFIYFGHSGLNVLGHERVLFGGGSKFSDIPTLTNLEQSPLAFLMTCDVGRFDFVEIPKWSVGLAEEMLFHAGGGSMALFTSAGRGLPSDHLVLLKSCLDMIVRGEVFQPGAILWGGKVQCLLSGTPNQSVDMFTLLGDPLYTCSLPRSCPVKPQKLRWNREGTLELSVDVSSLLEGLPAPQPRMASCWQVGDDLCEKSNWEHIPVNSKGSLQLTLPDARDLQKVLAGISLEGASRMVGILALDLSGFKRPDWVVCLGDGAKPNLSVDLDSIQFENYSPRNGESIFLKVTVRNDGTRTAEDVVVQGFSGQERNAFLNFANYPETRIRRLDPGKSDTVRLRWDWWDGTGDQTATVMVDSGNHIEESNEADNEATKTIRILEKPDLGWGLIRDCTSTQVDFSRFKAVPADWVVDPTQASMGLSAPFRPILRDTDRAIILEVPLSNFGETPSPTSTMKINYWHENESRPFFTIESVVVPPVPASYDKPQPKGVPLVLAPGCARIKMEIDPDNGMDERTRANNIIEIIPPQGFWEQIPVLKEKRTLPKALQRVRRQ